MNTISQALQGTIPVAASQDPAVSTRSTRSASDWDPIDKAHHTYLDRAENEFLDDSLSLQGLKLVRASVAPGKPGAPGVQTSTFAVDGVQSADIVVIKRMPATADASNFVLYVPNEENASFYAFKTREELTAWVKEVANDPATRAWFVTHFSHPAAPKQMERVDEKLRQFAAGDINAVVGSFAYEQGDIFTRLCSVYPKTWRIPLRRS